MTIGKGSFAFADRAPVLAPLRHAMFRAVWTASLVSNTGALIQTVASAWLMTTISTSESMVALVQAASVLPVPLFSVVCGAIADSYDRRRVMLAAVAFMFVVSSVLAVLAYVGTISPWLLLLFTFLVGTGAAVYLPAWQAAVGDLVPRDDLAGAVTLNATGNNVARSVGPALGGAIVATISTAAALVVNAVAYVPIFAMLWRWQAPSMQGELPRESPLLAISAGLRYAAMSPELGRIFLRSFMFGFAAIAVLALLPLVARDILGGDAFLYGVLFAGFGIGAVAGGLLSPTLRKRFEPEWIARIAFGAFAVAAATTAVSPFALLTLPALMVCGACQVISLSLCNISVQMWTPRWIVGRELALFHAAAFGGMALGGWVWGKAADHFGPAAGLELAAGAMVVASVAGLRLLRLPAPPTVSFDPANRWKAPAPTLEMTPRSGPIRITVEYRVAESDAAEFHRLMLERGKSRRRDGARAWQLARDIERPKCWIETYQFPTWTEYLRLGQRTTEAETLLTDRIKRLQCEGEAPRVRRLIDRPAPDRHAPSAESL